MSTGTSQSLKRTDSTGQLNVFIVLRLKATGSLKIISREDLAPSLRNGRLLLNQRVMIRDEMRNSIEGMVIFMHQDRSECIKFQEGASKPNSANSHGTHQSTQLIASQRDSTENTGNIWPNNKKNNNGKTSISNKRPEKINTNSSSNRQPTLIHARRDRNVHEIEDAVENDDSKSIDYDLRPSQTDKFGTIINDDRNSLNEQDLASDIGDNDCNNDVYIDKIKSLSLKVNQQATIIKQQQIEMKSLRSTSIAMPRDSATRNYITYVAEKIRQQTTGHRYSGHFNQDAKALGMKSEKLIDILKSKRSVTSIAREIFKTMVPEAEYSDKHWNNLPEDIRIKESFLIDFLVRYFGPVEVDPKKLHISLVGCIRNNRSNMKRQLDCQKNEDSNLDTIDSFDDDLQ